MGQKPTLHRHRKYEKGQKQKQMSKGCTSGNGDLTELENTTVALAKLPVRTIAHSFQKMKKDQ